MRMEIGIPRLQQNFRQAVPGFFEGSLLNGCPFVNGVGFLQKTKQNPISRIVAADPFQTLLNRLTDRIGVYDLAYITKQGVAALQLYRQFLAQMIMFRDIHRKFHPRGPALPLDQLILNDKITVHQLVGMLPDIIFVEF